MRVLLVTPYIQSVWDCGKLIMKALSELKHSLVLWDPYVTSKPPSSDYDLAFVMKGIDIVDVTKLKRPRINWYPDYISSFIRDVEFKKRLNGFIDEFDYFFTVLQSEKGIWVPGACDEDVHSSRKTNQLFDVVFVGTAHSEERVKFIKGYIRNFEGRVGIFGNGWDRFNIKAYPAQYFVDLAYVLSSTKIALNIHPDMFGAGVQLKIHEIAGCGSGMLLTDNVTGLEETYPMAPKFNSLEECLELTEYYLNNLRERRKLVKEMQKRAYEKFTYKHQVAKILEILEE
ncbi:glycosyltransferase family 1 protein [candidate division WOR-3 bacterium]|nr:glycosyltransferase family 1 protein [candidate division WOR-3 bacterium]